MVALPRKELALRTTATDALNTILYLQPLDLLAKSWASATALRLREAAAWTTGSTGHSNILSKHTSLPRSTDYVQPIVNIETRTDWDNLPHQFENAVNIYTDGSKLNSQTGGGVFSPELDIKVSFRLQDHCSVFQAEVMAIQEAITHLDTSVHHDIHTFIFSDSQAALRALDSYTTNSKTCKLHLRLATVLDSHGQTTTRKEQKLSYNVAGRTSPLS